MTKDEALSILRKEGRLYHEFYKDSGFGRGDCTAGWLIKRGQDYFAGKPIPNTEKFVVSFSESDGNYAGGETLFNTFDDFQEAYIYALGIEAYYKPIRDANRRE